MKRNLSHILLLYYFILASCTSGQGTGEMLIGNNLPDSVQVAEVEWADDATIYEVNIRQYTLEGTFEAFRPHLARLDSLGVEILWFMPIYPISEENRKGLLGSYYAVADYSAVNPAFGTMKEFKEVVTEAHDRGMRVLLDWVPNHTGWDHEWITAHPDWYTRDENGSIVDPRNDQGESYGWTDVADLNYDNEEMREAMIGEMLFWLKETDIDGFRCDVAHGIPDDFWIQAIPRLREVDPEIFMLAEAEYPPHRNTGLFAMSYGWSFHHLMNDIAQGQRSPSEIKEWYENDQVAFKRGYSMHFITNHDENSWNGTIRERLGDAGDAMAVLSFTLDGMPLIYSGQEAGLDKRLEFFEKDVIDWGDYDKQAFYAKLIALKTRNSALWNGEAGAEVEFLNTGDDNLLVYQRNKGSDRILVVLNLQNDESYLSLALIGQYQDVFTGNQLSAVDQMFGPWEYLVLEGTDGPGDNNVGHDQNGGSP